MSLANFEDIYQICCSWGNDGWDEELNKLSTGPLSDESVADRLFTGSSRWWEMAEKEIYKERDKVLN